MSSNNQVLLYAVLKQRDFHRPASPVFVPSAKQGDPTLRAVRTPNEPGSAVLSFYCQSPQKAVAAVQANKIHHSQSCRTTAFCHQLHFHEQPPESLNVCIRSTRRREYSDIFGWVWWVLRQSFNRRIIGH